LPDTVFYDGDCGFCHRTVRFLVARDPGGDRFRFAPLGGETFEARIDAAQRAGLPDSLVLTTSEGALLVRGPAALHVMRRLGGLYRLLAWLLGLLPNRILDAGYDWVAANRKRLAPPPSAECPVPEPALRARFDP